MAEFSCDGSIGDWLESLTGRSDGSVTRAPIDDIEDWSKTQSPWRQDCLRRLATSDDLSEQDHAELLAIIRASVGLPVTAHPPVPIPFTKAHYSGERQKPIVLKGIANVDGVNRLMPKASLNFCPTALTVIYGRNGSGKSGFVRILRTACRTRISNPAKLKVLADVYGDGGGIQTADILIDDGSGDAIVKWTPGQAANPQLMQVSVFDSSSAQLYVDQGNQIHFLPFGLALPHRLNSVCLLFKTKLEAERSAEVTGKADLAVVAFPVQRDTAAQRFNRMLNKDTSDADILDQAGFPPADQERLDAISTALAAGAAAIADLDALAKWMRAVARECEIAVATLSDPALDALLQLKARATKARLAARTSAAELFSDDPLPGVGSETWHTLWKAARNFSLSEAYVGREFPVTDVDGEGASCVLCQQPLQQDGAERLRRFQKYVDDTLDAAATAAEQAVADAQAGLPALLHLMTDDFVDHLGQLRGRDLGLGDALAVFQSAAVARREDAEARLAGSSGEELAEIIALHAELDNLAAGLESERNALATASDGQERMKLVAEKAELEDRKLLATHQVRLTTRRDLLKMDDAYLKALAEVQTKGITQRANELLDWHLTAAVQTQFDVERECFDISHLRVGLTRKSGQTKAEFEVDAHSTMTKVASDILSEGEQRALALAGFLTEVSLTEGSGPIVVDDPVSSLDRDRGRRVAERLADEAAKRQVIVFTHDIIFFNDLCVAAEARGLNQVTIALFSDRKSAGKVDPSGMLWKGLAVSKRIGRIKDAFAPVEKLYDTSPAEYEIQVKNIYGRLRDTYERVVEEVIFRDVVRRGSDVIHTQMLRYVALSNTLALRFHEGMTKANTYSHDNPESETVPVPDPDTFRADVASLEALIEDLRQESNAAEAARPQMRPKK